jgi:hypothetical protein
LDCDYVYGEDNGFTDFDGADVYISGLTFSNGAGALTVEVDADQLDRVDYTDFTNLYNGVNMTAGDSAQLDIDLLDPTDNDDSSSWCLNDIDEYDSSGSSNYGTPGSENIDCGGS